MRFPSIVTAALIMSVAAPSYAVAQRIKLPVKFDELEQIARRDSNDAAAHYNLALGHWSRKSYDAAEDQLREALALDARLAPAYLALAYLPFARNDDLWDDWAEPEWEETMREADRMYERAFMIDPIVELKIVGAVVPKRSVLWSHDPSLARFYDRWIQAFDDFRDAKYEDAYYRFDRFIHDAGGRKRLKNIPRSFIWFQALSAAHLERYDDAVELTRFLLQDALGDRDPDRLTYLPVQENGYRYLLAYLVQQSGKYDEAVQLYQTALEQDFGLYMAHVRLAEIHEARGDAVAGLRERQLAVEANPGDASLLLDLGIAQAKAGQTGQARITFSDMTATQPRDPRPYYFLGLLHQMDGSREDARSSLERFLDLAPERFGPQIRDARSRLAAL